jgi:hypothetical protein
MTTVPPAAWPPGDLEQFGGADEISISTRRADGSLRPFVPIWIVAVGEALYVRSYRGVGGAWYRHAAAHPAGAIQARGIHRDVKFIRAEPASRSVVDAAYRAKYARYGDSYLQPMLADQAVGTTLRIDPDTEPDERKNQ